jgi:hypothetical protein
LVLHCRQARADDVFNLTGLPQLGVGKSFGLARTRLVLLPKILRLPQSHFAASMA